MSENRNPRLIPGLALTSILATFAFVASVHADDFVAPERAPSAWLDRLSFEDRVPIEDWIGYVPPRFDAALKWVTPDGVSTPDSWNDYYGKVVVIQSWSASNDDAIQRLDEVIDVVMGFSPIDVQLVSLHVPSGADQAEQRLRDLVTDRRHIAAIDSEGHFCDLLGVYQTPVNLVISRNGAVRYAGLSPDGLREAVNVLLDEDPTSAPCSGTRPIVTSESEAAAPSGPTPQFPPATGGNIRAHDLRGQTAPLFLVENWIANEPRDIGSRVTMIEFWRTNCPHCINAIPKKNELVQEFGDRIHVVAITGEAQAAVEQGLSRRNVSLDNIQYSIASDPRNRMANIFRPQGVPNAAVIDSNWIVRWQGHPASLTPTVLRQMIEADEAQRGPVPIVKRWHPDPDLDQRPRLQRASGPRIVAVEPRRQVNADEERAQLERQADSRRTIDPTADARHRRGADAAGTTGGFPAHNSQPRARNLQGQPAPEFQVETWAANEPEQIEGKVNVIKFWRTNCPHCISAIPKSRELAEKFAGRVNFIDITHENLETLRQGLAQRQLSLDAFGPVAVAIDSQSRMRIDVGSQGVPNAMIVDSNWTVRWQGHPAQISEVILEQIVLADQAQEKLPRSEIKRATSAQPSAPEPRTRSQQPAVEVGSDDFPRNVGDVRAAIDLRGRTGPPFFVQSWITDVPKEMDNPVVIIEFFATWCPHCRNTIPKLNDLVEQFPDQLSIIVVSDEQRDAFLRGMQQHNLDPNTWKFAAAVDPTNRMKNAIQPRGVPSAIVLGSDWTVRWQGHPAGLNAAIIDQIIRADEARRKALASSESGQTDRKDTPPASAAPAERIARGPVDFPATTSDTRSGVDLQGKPGPAFHVQRWMTAQPLSIGDRVTVVEFFATWCPHCRNAIPKINEMNVHFGDRVTFIAISDEIQQAFTDGLAKHNLSLGAFNHFVALDPESKLKNAIGPAGVPFAIVLDRNWIVRWQGHPNNLTIDLLDQIVRADASQNVRASR